MFYNGLQLYAVVCRLCAVEKLRIGAVMRMCGGLSTEKLNFENETEKIKNRSDGKKRNIIRRLFGTYERYSKRKY
jgi:hypothetical protein